MNLEACWVYSKLGHLSPSTQPFLQASAQLIVSIAIALASLFCSEESRPSLTNRLGALPVEDFKGSLSSVPMTTRVAKPVGKGRHLDPGPFPSSLDLLYQS